MMPFKCSYFFQASILLVLLCTTTPSSARLSVKVSSELITEICSKALHHDYCLQLLKSTPGVANADLKGLGKILLDLARNNATTTLNNIRSLIPTTSDPKLKESYKSCSKHYDDAIGDLKDSEDDLNKGDYYGMNVQASGAVTGAGDCDDETKKLAIDPSITKGNQDLDHICGVILVVANLLRGAKN